MVTAARYFSAYEHFGTLAHCALCGSPSGLKLVGKEFLCRECLSFGDWLNFSVPDGGSEVVSSTPPARPCPGVTQMSFPFAKLVGDDTTAAGGTT